MYVAPYFLIAFFVNFGLLAALGMASDEPLWGLDTRLIGCAGYAALVALVFSMAGFRRVSQGSIAPVKRAVALAAEYQTREAADQVAEPMIPLQPVYPRASKAPAPKPIKGELVT
ncbi:MAG: hypothetical protein QM749_20200 [Aquabacterium sp.]